MKKSLDKIVFMQQWEESERGWGIRPDGCSLHISLEDCEQYVKEYWAGMPNYVPDEYERPCGQPYSVRVAEDLYKKIEDSKNGIRLWGHQISELEDRGLVKDVGNQNKAWVRVKQ